MDVEFDLAEVEAGIGGTGFAGRVMHLRVVDSTNRLAMEAAAGGAAGGVWVADEQTAGRGRGGHAWHSAAGEGLYVSMLVTPPSGARTLPMATGLAVQTAVEEVTGLRLDLRWPNDLMFGDRKCGGILVESAVAEGKLRYAVIGVGLNVNHAGFPAELAAVATSLFLESGRRFEREALVAALLRAMDGELGWVDSGATLFRRFAEGSSWVTGKRVRVDEGGGYTGVTRGLNSEGFLLVEEADGTLRTVLSGGVRSA